MLSPVQLILLVIITVAGIILSYITHFPLAVGFLLGFMTLLGFARKIGVNWNVIGAASLSGALRTNEVIWILGLVGLMIPAWTASGTIPYMIDMGLSLVHPNYLLTYSFLLAATISMLLGTSMGTLSSIGLPLMGVGAILQVPLPAIAGALISGAMLGDRTSPLSSARQLVATSTETDMKQQGKVLLPSTLAALVCSILLFLSLDGVTTKTEAAHYMEGYDFTPWFSFQAGLLIPPVLLVTAILLKMKTKVAFLLSIASSLVLGSLYQHIEAREWFHYLVLGYDETTLTILHSKGLFDMVELMFFIALTGAFNGILEKTEMIQPYMKQILGSSPSLVPVTCRTVVFGFILNLVSCNQTLPIMITSRNLLPIWRERFDRKHLSRVVADSSGVFAALIPWNMLAILAGTIMGVPVLAYIPYAIFIWSLPLWTIGISWYYDKQQKKWNRSKKMAQKVG